MDYIQKLKSLCNTLTSIGEPVSRKDNLFYMFNGLDKEYNVFVASINNHLDLPSIEKIHNPFLSYDFRLEQQHCVYPLNNAQAYATYLQTQKKPLKFSQNQPYYSSQNTNQKHSQSSSTQFPYQSPNNQPGILPKPQK